MKTVNLHAAKTQLSRLVDQAVGRRRGGHSESRHADGPLVPIGAKGRRSGFGTLKGKIRIADDFYASLPDDRLRGFSVKR